MSLARDLADLGAVTSRLDTVGASSGALSNRNLIINGAMQVAQRGTSATTNGYGSVDRFSTLYSGGTLTQSQETLTSGSPYDNGFRNFYRVTVTSVGSNAASDYCYIAQQIEAQNLASSGWNYASSDSSITIQFWVRSSLAGTYYCALTSQDGTSRTFVIPVVLSANTWTKITKAISGDSSLQFDNNNGSGLDVTVRPYVGTNFSDSSVNTNVWYNRTGSTQTPDYSQNFNATSSATFDLTGVQLEVGDPATDFEHRSFGDELALCQRYYYLHASGATAAMGMGDMYVSSQLDCVMHFPTEMRATPSLDATSGSNYYLAYGGATSTNVTNAWNLFAPTKNAATVFATPTSTVTAGTAMRVLANNASASIAFDAEL